MRKTYSMLLALLLMAMGAVNANADETISLQEVPFTTWDGYGPDASQGDAADCAWVLDESTGQPYGDPSVINGADLSLYTKLIIKYTEGTPRILMNRDVNEGQWNADESQSHLIEYPKDGWSSKYFNNNTEEGVLTVDLKQILKDKGFVRLHAIKGANWGNVTVTSMEVVRQGKAQVVGWVNLINNGTMEGDDVSSFFTRYYPYNEEDPVPNSEITDGVGRDGSRGIVVNATDKGANPWDNQFWFRFNEPVPAGTKYRVSFDYRADEDAGADTQAHAEPSDYIWYDMFGKINFTTDWQTFTKEGEVTTSQSTDEKQFLSVAFNLNDDSHPSANNYYFDNIKFEVYKYGTTAEFYEDIVLVDFGFDTNIPDLVTAGGRPRLLFPNDCVTLTADGEKVELLTVEGFADGRFYIFPEEALDENAEVVVNFTNPTDPAYRLVYTSGPGGDVSDFSVVATYNDEDLQVGDAYSYLFVQPTVIAADPEDGAFNLPNNISEFKITFDKNADCSKLVATLNGKALTVTPSTGFAEQVVLTRTGADLADGTYVLKLDKIFCESPLDDTDFSTWTATISVGKVVIDPNDVPKEMLGSSFAETAAGNIPAGYTLTFLEEVRTAEGGGYSSGPRMFDFAAGGDFTKGLYFREGYVEYGSMEGYKLPLQAGKKYIITFNTAMWKDNGANSRFEILNSYGERVYVTMTQNKPNVNGSTAAVSGSTRTEYTFIPEVSDEYIVRWTAAASEDGDPGFFEVVLGNPSVRYMPNVVGIEETALLNAALASAKEVRDANSDDRFSGPAFDALTAAINKYEAEGPTYTNPSAYRQAAAVLEAVSKAMKDHRALCDTYDPLPSKAWEIVAANADNKFAGTDLYAQLKAVAEQYGSMDEFGFVTVKVLKDDAELQTAIDQMKNLVSVTGVLFTEGVSKTGDSGIKVLVDRLRQGAEGLQQLGVSEFDWLVQAALNALTDDDNMAEDIKNRIKVELYGQLKDASNTLFQTSIDPTTDEEITPTYNMTVFVKNPNIYAHKVSDGFSAENVPGWDVPVGSGEISTMWVGGTPRNIDGVAEDVTFTKYHSTVRMQQTVTDLPAGIYNVVVDATCWEWHDDGTLADCTDSYAFVKTSQTPEVEEGAEEDRDVNFAAYVDLENYGQYSGHHDCVMPGIVVTDGILTFGANFGPNSQFMFDQVHLYLAGAATGFDYAAAYEQALAGVDVTTAQPQTVRAFEMYDLNGRRVSVAQKGITIVRKLMSDGSVRTEKVVVK